MTLLLILSFSLFSIGSFGMFLYKKHFMIMLMSLELLLLAVNLQLMIFSVYLDDLMGQIYCLLTLTVAAAESSMGLAILMVFYKLRGGMAIDLVNLLKG